MKLIYAGINGNPSVIPENFLFNCIRNTKCQKPYFVPVHSIGDLMLYADVPFGTIQSHVVTVIGCKADGTPIGEGDTVESCNYGYGTLPGGGNFAIFTGFQSDTILLNFFVKIIITVAGIQHVYFSEQFEIENCLSLTDIQACYGENIAYPETQYDCNGIYYGKANVGNTNLRYVHKGFVRQGNVIERSNKITTTLFNSRLSYKAVLTKEFVFQCETVPRFYKDHLISIFTRGNIFIDAILYTISEESEAISENDSILWTLDIALKSICKQFFGCNSSVCEEIPAMPCNNFTGGTYDADDEEVTLTGATLLTDEKIEWELYQDETLIDNGISDVNPIAISIPDTDIICYNFRVRKLCICDVVSDWHDIAIGDCGGGTGECTCEPEITSFSTTIEIA